MYIDTGDGKIIINIVRKKIKCHLKSVLSLTAAADQRKAKIMENKAHFGSLTPRMQAYRESVLDQKPYIDAQRAVLATEAYKKNMNQPPVMKRALMLQNILAGMDIYIEDETILVGNQSSVNRGAPVFPEYTMKFIMDELDLFEKRDGDVFYITEETKQQLRDIAPFWENNNLRSRGEALMPEEMQVYMDTGFFGMEGKLNAGDAHLAVDYESLLRLGLKGYEARTRQLKADLDLTEPESIDKYQFYKAVLIVIDAVRGFAARFADLARKKAEAADEVRKAELLEIELPDDVTEYIATRLKTNIRQLEGVVKKLKAKNQLYGDKITINIAQKTISEILNNDQPSPLTVETIIDEVARHFGLTGDDIRSSKRNSNVSNARKIAIYAVREITNMSMNLIGEEFGGRDHSTIVYALKQMDKKMEKDPKLKSTVEDIIKNIRNR